ncbi:MULTISPECIES: outer membrane beta-barrel protein [unclassified Flavobacterium]|uniref:outer membrane beta-barrel protein n=1 Tax=unclassified Flavobacterium TaxID=196869 RepID=UPI0025C71FD2|nr:MULTISPECIES: outer membrane beta-barrel protein [unclassified Flavobacterium]
MNSIKLLFIATLLFSLSSNAQITKGNWMVGGTGSFDSYRQEQTFIYQPTGLEANVNWSNQDIEISAKVGYFVIDKLVLGVTPTYTRIKSKTISNDPNWSGGSQDTYKFSLGPFARYYFLSKDKPFNILTEVNYQLGVSSMNIPPKERGSLNKFTFLVGPEIFFNSSVGIEVLLGYKTSIEKIKNPYYPSNQEKGFQVAVGFQIHLEKR